MARRCQGCGLHNGSETASAYWVFYDSAHNRQNYRMRMCLPCVEQWLAPIIERDRLLESGQDDATCLKCGGDTHTDSAWLWVNAFLPGQEMLELEAEFCDLCIDIYLQFVSKRGRHTRERAREDRNGKSVSPAWAALLGSKSEAL